MQKSLAPEGSGRKATFLGASEETRNGKNVYQFEYRIDRGVSTGAVKAAGDSDRPPGTITSLPSLRAISVIAVSNNNLITMTVVAPEKDWVDAYEIKLRTVAESFKLT